MKWISLLICGVFLVAVGCQKNPYQQGSRLYSIHCANCHMEDAKGLMSLYPPLDADEFENYSDQFACIIRNGLSDSIRIGQKTFVFPMPAIPQLNHVEISNIYNYIVHQWHPKLPVTSAQKVLLDLEKCTK